MANINFALVLFWATVVTGIFWFADLLVFKKRRETAFADAVRSVDAKLKGGPEAERAKDREMAVEGLRRDVLAPPLWMEFTGGLFPVISIVFALRSFVAEPFKIPSGSMIPTLQIGDFILVNKFTYGVRLPVIHTKVMDMGSPQRGDVMVFRYPPEPTMDYIKRVVGLPGDTVAYLDKKLTVNGVPVPTVAQKDYLHKENISYSKQFEEKLGSKTYRALNDDDRPAAIFAAANFMARDGCNYSERGVTCKVPAGHYFLMGDNRDNSLDSRYWGFVPEANIVGKAFFVWMNFGDLKRIGSFE
jgi:signal peptidase I